VSDKSESVQANHVNLEGIELTFVGAGSSLRIFCFLIPLSLLLLVFTLGVKCGEGEVGGPVTLSHHRHRLPYYRPTRQNSDTGLVKGYTPSPAWSRLD
jgi:hypothetical protein